MDFSKITAAVIGLGLMGGSFAMRLKELGAAVIGINRTLSTAEAALRQGIVDSIDISDLKHADIVIFCTPAKATLAFVKNHLPDFRSDAIMTDIAGVKGNLADDIRQILPPGMDFISSHPMCGHEGEGLSGRIRTFSAEQIISFFPIKRTARRVWNCSETWRWLSAAAMYRQSHRKNTTATSPTPAT